MRYSGRKALAAKREGHRPGSPRRMVAERINYYCIMLEGLFNTLGNDIMGMNTIVPLFLADYGASLGLIGALPTAHGIVGAVTPLLSGGFIAAAPSKRRLSLILNGIGRGLILLIPLSLLLGFSPSVVVGLFFAIIMVYYVCQSATGISWNYLLGDCVEPGDRGTLLGTLFACSGMISFLSSNIIRVIRETPRLDMSQRYAFIFGLAGVLMAVSVLFFLPLREKPSPPVTAEERNVKAYLASLALCLKNRPYRRVIRTQAFSQICTGVNTFLYIFTQNILGLGTERISYMIIVQTLGVVFGGLITGRISSRFGTKRTLLLVESLGLAIPILSLIAMRGGAGAPLMLAAAFVMGFSRSGFMAYQSHLLEVAEKERSIYYLVVKSLLLLPFSFVSILVGLFIERFSIAPVFAAQVIASLLAVASATQLTLFVYKKPSPKKDAA